jgi:hypothetical protein
MRKSLIHIAKQYEPVSPTPWLLLELTFTTDGPRTRVCDGRYASREEAEAARTTRLEGMYV